MNQTTLEKPSQKSHSYIISFFSGGLAGVIAKTATAPIERIKLLLQTQVSNERVIRPYKGIHDCFYRTLTEEGVLALWRGNMANVIRYFPTQALNFSFKEMYQDTLISKNSRKSSDLIMANLLAGGLAGCTSTLFVYPLDMARTRLGVDLGRSLNERQFKGIFDCISKIYRADGMRGLYKGLGICLGGIFVYRGLYFGIYDSGKSLIPNYDNQSLLTKLLFAQFCVVFSETISYPTDTIKRKLMLQSAKKEIMYTGTWDCTVKVWKKEGIQGFFRGNLTNIMRGIGSSLCLVLYDEIKRSTDKYAAQY